LLVELLRLKLRVDFFFTPSPSSNQGRFRSIAFSRGLRYVVGYVYFFNIKKK
jgi:hypothetical protein